MTGPPRGIYLVAIVFFASGLLCAGQLLQVVFEALGLHGLNLANSRWFLSGYVVAFCLVLCGVALLARLHPLPRWLMFGMTLFLTIQAVAMPAGDSPFYSASRIYVNRALMVLPLIDEGAGKDSNCAKLIAELSAAAKTASKKPPAA